MATDSEEYLAVLKASYDYQPQSEDEIAIKEDQLLFLKERVDDDWWKVKIKPDSQEEDSPVGLVPAAYVEQAEHSSVVRALYDYEAAAPGELSVKEGELLLLFETEEDWLLVQSKNEGGKAGFVPGNYVEAISDGETPVAPANIIVPPSPPKPVSTYVDPADRVAAAKVRADDEIKTWSVSELDKKGKKKKGTLGIGNGAVFFASEADKTPVQKWQTIDIEHISLEKSKHVHIDVGGAVPISLHFHAGSKDNAEAIIAKLQSSKTLSTMSPPNSPGYRESVDEVSHTKPTVLDALPKKASVHFSPASPVIIPSRDDPEEEEEGGELEQINNGEYYDGQRDATATALYDFVADGADELSVSEGESLVILERDGDEWWKCQNAKGARGVVPASYLEVSAATSKAGHSRVSSASDQKEVEIANAQKAEERMKAERSMREQELIEDTRRKKIEAQKRAEDAAAAAEAERQKRKDAAARTTPPVSRAPPPSSNMNNATGNSASPGSSRTSSESRPPPERTRVWHDRSGQFRVEAAFLGFNGGKLRLHKVNGVIVEVPSEKMSVEDMRYVEKMTAKKSRPTPSQNVSDDDVPLGLSRPGATVGNQRSSSSQKNVPKIDWFDFFLSAGCDIDDCTRYAASFERDKIDESILPDITDGTMRSLGLREGDIIRVTKAIEKRKPVDKTQKSSAQEQEQLIRDEEMAKQLHAQDSGGSSRSPAPNLFAGPGGVLKNPRRGRPQPSKSLPPSSIDLNAISTASDQIQRTTSPSIRSPINTNDRRSSSAVQPPPRSSSAVAASTGFEDDAWTNRSSSTKPLAGTPPNATPRAPSAPPASIIAAPVLQPTSMIPVVPAPPPTQSPPTSLAKTTEADIFDQLSRLGELRKTSSLSNAPTSLPPTIATSPVGFQPQVGNIMNTSPAPPQLQNQQTGLPPQQIYNGPRGPFAPVPSNQSLLQPLIPTQTGFNSFIPTRPGNTSSPFQNQQPAQPLYLSQQPTGIAGNQLQPSSVPFNPFNPAPYQANAGFSQVQTNYTGFNPNFGQPPLNGGMSSPPPPPQLMSSASNNTSPANIFAQMKSGTFAVDNDTTNPQLADKYNALRQNPLAAQPTGWAQPYQGGYPQYQH